MTKRLLAAAAALALTAGAAQASTIDITVDVFSAASYTAILGTMGNVVTEDFENLGPERNVDDGFATAVGTFRSVGGKGDGGTVKDGIEKGNFAGNDGHKLALRDGNVYGRRSTTALLPTGDREDDMFLDSNDTHGIEWTVDVGSAFSRILLTLTDATDVGATMRITANGVSASWSGLVGSNNKRDGNIQTLVIDFGGKVAGATILFENFNGNNWMLNDGFSIDDIAVSTVPLPAPALMLIAGVAGLAAFRRKRAAA